MWKILSSASAALPIVRYFIQWEFALFPQYKAQVNPSVFICQTHPDSYTINREHLVFDRRTGTSIIRRFVESLIIVLDPFRKGHHFYFIFVESRTRFSLKVKYNLLKLILKGISNNQEEGFYVKLIHNAFAD